MVKRWGKDTIAVLMTGTAILAIPSAAFSQAGTQSAGQPQNLLPAERPAAQPRPARPQPAPISSEPVQTDTAQPAADQSEPMTVDTRIETDAQRLLTEQDDATTQFAWTLAQAGELVDVIRNIGAEGLDPGDYRLPDLNAAIDAGEGAQLNRTASEIFAWLVEDVRDGRTPMDGRKQWFVVDPDADRYPTQEVMRAALTSGDISGTLMKLAPVHPDYARLRDELAATPLAKDKRRKLIVANMDRWRWLARDLGSQYLMTNVPEYQLRLTVNDQIISTYRTIVGKPGRTATPQIAELVEGVVFNPTWTVPQSIVKGEGLGNKVLNNPSWARTKGYKATRGANGWTSVVQQPGPGNALGLMKLHMPNKHAIFLHDTPSRGLFKQAERALSHGCIRTERAQELAITLAILGNASNTEEGRQEAAAQAVEISAAGKYKIVPIEKEMPVYITYFTMAQDIDGKLRSFPDIYGRDKAVLDSFEAPRKANRSRVTGEQVIPIVFDGA
ncbi:putative L,D-transpeptidase [Alteripontixanthobacter maritimus]|uniref:Putative L,D-transpeptidase n=2 Tax=Alteripontixanthobacter maritimus TaxID=2161824 RepID=A0A369QB46_9SPHN|nr:L,D-transpeptidase family protein [Alteripontixanthobacter maritimus]RDC60775.1 putative L,D-transpeptidase [Alteripontixanthobacter maritimus]